MSRTRPTSSTEFAESQEDYLKAIHSIARKNKGGWVSNSEISEILGVTPASVTGMLYKLKGNGLISWRPRSSLRLTKKGKQVAETLETNFNRLKEFFIHILKLKNKELVNELCCGIEHHITPEVADALEDLLR